MVAVDISVIIPCYNEQKVIKKNAEQIVNILDKFKVSYEIIFIDDLSSDDTREIIVSFAKKYPQTRYLFHKKNEGRGKSVADGIRMSHGKVSGFIDLDLATPAYYIPIIYDKIVEGNDVAIADRYYKLSLDSIWIIHRYVLHKLYRFLVHLLLKPKVKDTETGCKFFNTKKILPLLNEVHDNRWFWDTEIMTRASYKNLKMVEIPTIYIRKKGTTVKIVKDSFDYFIKLMIFWWKKDYLKYKPTRD